MPFVEPTAVHQPRQSSNGRGNEVQNNVESSKSSTNTNDNPDGSNSNSPGQSQQVGNASNQAVNLNAGYIQNRTQGKKILVFLILESL